MSDPGTTVAFRTVGCRLNQCETAQMQEALSTAGFRLVEWDETAQVRVINTCTVTAKSDRTCRHEIHAARRRDPGCLLVLTGCLAQVDPAAAAAVQGVDLVLGNPDKSALARHLTQYLGAAPRSRASGGARGAARPLPRPAVAVTAYPERPMFETESFTHFHGRTRAFLKVQNGCDSHCSYCIVPSARGPARSMAREDVLAQVRLLSAQSYREIVLTGIDLGSWGKDTGEGALPDLLEALLDDPEGAGAYGRLRLSSVEPLEVTSSLLDVVANAGDLLARHFHLPLQSGSDSILARMDRPYVAEEYLEVTTELRRRLPDAAIGADVIVGFPGETDEEFDETVCLVQEAPLTYLHVFAYSDRPGTPATAMRPKIKPEVIKERSERLRGLGAHKKHAFRDRLVGSQQRVLVLEEQAEDGRLVGLTGNYVEVLVERDESLINRFVRARLERALPGDRMDARMIETED